MGRHIHNLARSMIDEIGIEFERRGCYLRSSFEHEINSRLHRMRAETLGRIAAQGKVGSEYLSRPDLPASGRSVLIEIARKAIIGEMFDIFRHREEVEDRKIMREFDRSLGAK